MRFVALVALIGLFSHNALAGTAASTPTAPIKEADETKWSFSASASTYIVPDFQEYVQPTFTADHDWLHIETRYNYEDLATGSTWVGYNFSGGRKLEWEFTPMLGAVLGRTTGIARRRGNLVDEGPLHVVFAELIRVPGPASAAYRLEQRLATDD